MNFNSHQKLPSKMVPPRFVNVMTQVNVHVERIPWADVVIVVKILLSLSPILIHLDVLVAFVLKEHLAVINLKRFGMLFMLSREKFHSDSLILLLNHVLVSMSSLQMEIMPL